MTYSFKNGNFKTNAFATCSQFDTQAFGTWDKIIVAKTRTMYFCHLDKTSHWPGFPRYFDETKALEKDLVEHPSAW